MAFPQIKTPLPLTVRKRQRRKNSSAVPLLLPVQSPAPQCASNNARPVITGACRSCLLGRTPSIQPESSERIFPRTPCTALHQTGSSLQHSFRVLFLVIAEYFTAPQYTLPQGQSQGMGPVGFFIWFASGMKAVQARAAILSYSFFWLSVRVGSTPPIMASANSCVSTSTYSMPLSCSSL